MKKLLTTLLFGSIFSACAERQPVPAIPSDPEIEGKNRETAERHDS